jgi:hypothetical protein
MADEAHSLSGALLLGEKKVVVNMGVEVFEDSLRRQGIEVVVVRWQPPRELPQDVARLLDRLL